MIAQDLPIYSDFTITVIGVKELERQEQWQAELFVYRPLMFQWVLWGLKPGNRHQWAERLCKLAVFDTIEAFWSVRRTTFEVSSLPVGSDFFLFRAGINPDWEDPMNLTGGRWQAVLPQKSYSVPVPGEVAQLLVTKESLLELCWLKLKMSVLGAQYGIDNSHICGVAAHVRGISGDKVALWISDASDEGLRKRVREVFISKLPPPGIMAVGMSVSESDVVPESRMEGDDIQVSFQTHTDSIKYYVDIATRDYQANEMWRKRGQEPPRVSLVSSSLT